MTASGSLDTEIDRLTDSPREGLMLQADGSFAGFDDKELTSQSGGKASAARLIKV